MEMSAGTSSPVAKVQFKLLCVNWCLTLLAAFNTKSGYAMSFSSLYNFVTNPKNDSCGTSGLGESETIYAIASGMYSGGSVIGGLIAAALLTKVHDYRRVLTIGPILQVLGGVLYATSTTGWMVILARFINGVNCGLTAASSMSYYTLSTSEYNKSREAQGLNPNNGLKKRLMIIFSLVSTFSYIPLSLLVSWVSQFPVVNQFRWIGWFQGGLSTLVVLLMLCLFQNQFSSTFTFNKVHLENKARVQKADKLSCSKVLVILYLLVAGFVIDMAYAVVDTITSQILNNYFGFSTKYISYFFIGALAVYPLGSVLLLLSQKFKLSSRVLLLALLLLGMAGVISLSDWQSIPYNECSNYNVSIASHSDCPGSMQSCVDINNLLSEVCPSLSSDNDDHLTLYYYKSTSFINQSDPQPCDSESCWQYKVSGDELCRSNEDVSTNKHNIDFRNVFQDQESNYSLCLSKATPILTVNHSCAIEIAAALMSANSVPIEQRICESNEDCYWNPNSFLTGEYCTDCLPACHSRSGSIHFFQLCVGFVVLPLATVMGHYILYPIITKVTPSHIQVLVTSLLVFIQSLSSLITPLWMNSVYILAGRQTFAVTSIMLLCQVPILIGYFIFYSLLSTSTVSKDKKSMKEHRPSISSVVPFIESVSDDAGSFASVESNDGEINDGEIFIPVYMDDDVFSPVAPVRPTKLNITEIITTDVALFETPV